MAATPSNLFCHHRKPLEACLLGSIVKQVKTRSMLPATHSNQLQASESLSATSENYEGQQEDVEKHGKGNWLFANGDSYVGALCPGLRLRDYEGQGKRPYHCSLRVA